MNEISPSDRCVCCGEYVPEGRQVCTACEYKAQQEYGYKPIPYRRQIWLIIKSKFFGGARKR